MLIIKTNKHWHNCLYGYELTEKEAKEFDYIDEKDFPLHDFARYRGVVYDLHEFIPTRPGPFNPGLPVEFGDWDGYASDSFFSGVLIKLSEDGEQYQIGTYYS